MTKKRMILGGVAAFVALGIIGSFTSDPADEEAGAPTAETTSTDVRAVAATEAPSQEACPSAEQIAYATAIADPWDALAKAYGSMGTLFGDAGNNPMLMFDETWRLRVAATLATMQNSDRLISAIQAPASMEHIHRQMTQVASVSGQEAGEIAAAIDAMDSDRLAGAVARMLDEVPTIQRMTDDLNNVCG